MMRILMILTSQATMGDTSTPTGVWFEELTTPYYRFVDAGATVELASVKGGAVPLDPHSTSEQARPASVSRFMADTHAMQQLQQSLSIQSLDISGYDAIFLPGGHGTMWDLPASRELTELLNQAWANQKILAAVCHGPAGLVNLQDTTGQPLVSGRKVAGFSNSEEAAAGLTSVMPFLLETRLRELGAHYESGPDFQPFAVRDGRLITGQNPASSEPVADLVLQALR
ncbi:type 1 glutamine amidotransferase domain-containing protein [Parathalassolituus penaei]|uniref:Type 1 glutamine amidotransferase domain-containing protein n=1 Tax=Parathalassolituus penaei TaxID=2997323 RepID=A0A9X3ECP9_9GAMM|nr:type 1 glutamine amidotransferase domain-containing protein [Parathalassolituus penaei]MCY0964725.1 type 1 glutamine amidotransferase domain-containing protein [Parathalassolituus penaei]